MADRYRSPILASITRGFAWTGVLMAIALGYVGYLGAEVLAQTPRFDPASSQWAPLRFGAYLPAMMAAGWSLAVFGVAQLIEYIGRISFNSGLLVEVTERSEILRAGHAREAMAAMRALGDSIKRSVGTASASAGSGLAAERFFYVDSASQALGPVAREELQHLVEAGRLSTDSLVCCEGAEQWTTLGEII